MRIPFDIERKYNNYYTNIEFYNFESNSKMNEFYNKITRLELFLLSQINKYFKRDLRLKSQIKQNSSFNPFITIKTSIKNIKNIKIENPSLNILTLLDLNKNTKCNFIIYIDKLWINEKQNVLVLWWKFDKIIL